MSEHEAWAKRQLAALLDLGVSAIDADRSIRWVIRNLPRGVDPDDYVFPSYKLEQEVSSEAAIQDVRVYVYGENGFERKFKRILDASGQ